MSRRYAKPSKPAKSATDDLIGKPRSCHRWFKPVIDELRLIFPHKCAEELALMTGRSKRVCEIWLSEKSVPDSFALVKILTSDHGDRLYGVLIRPVRHSWAQNFRAVSEISKIRKQQREAELRLKALEQGIQ